MEQPNWQNVPMVGRVIAFYYNLSKRALELTAIPLLVSSLALAYIAFPVAAIALAIDGKWSFIWWGIVVSLVIPFVYALAALPNILLIGNITAWLFKPRGIITFISKPVGCIFLFFGLVYSVVIIYFIVAWVFFNFPTINDIAPQETLETFRRNYSYLDWKASLWCYSVSTSPFAYMASKENTLNPHPTTASALISAHILALLFLINNLLHMTPLYTGLLLCVWFLASLIHRIVITIRNKTPF